MSIPSVAMNLLDVNPLDNLSYAQSDSFLNSFSGSYTSDQVQLLLRLIDAQHTNVEEKERLIQTGQKHYSEMISLESAPSELHQQVYQQAVAEGLPRLAREIQALALALQQHAKNTLENQPLVLVSLVRAGLPIGVMLQHALKDLGVPVLHYGVSIIRDRGLDAVAYAQIRQQHAYAQLVFVDGWTGKGAISRELRTSVQIDPEFDGVVRLVTLADVSGYAWLTASSDDWLIPSGVLGATVSGLISRTLYQANQLHGCLLYYDLQAYDHSRDLIEQVNQERHLLTKVNPAIWPEQARQQQQQIAASVIATVAERFDIQQPNRIKPSLAEATRAVLRRVPERIILRNANDPQTRLLRHLATEQGAPIVLLGEAIAPYRAITIIQRRGV